MIKRKRGLEKETDDMKKKIKENAKNNAKILQDSKIPFDTEK